ncbi:hypothetical protein GOQ29_04105 [Clostridium sp. D2Q-14]|uniref:PAS domain-containing sensor histidine kinase n=1 Tax=Anaeromonas gelatinilytica TaxID=2683194 RepID=UPI00193BDE8D|nr:PAS domain-containing sensor histidine kinase [Anaeromonas gelatinilytica]MBS4534796.1 hypothetical protein [Anaeromonas gelatinilytica]
MDSKYQNCEDMTKSNIMEKEINPLVKKSWASSKSYGIKSGDSGKTIEYTKQEFKKIMKEYDEVIKIISSYANILLANSIECDQLAINLFDRQCYLIHQWGHKDYISCLREIGLIRGTCWKNKVMGTNGPGEAYLLDKTIIIEGYEQYLKNRKNLSQISVPIHDAKGNLFCILDITIPDKENVIYYYNTLVMICNGTERELKRMDYIDNNSVNNQYSRSLEDYAFVNDKFLKLIKKYKNRNMLLNATFNQHYTGTAYYSHDGETILDANEKYVDIVREVSESRIDKEFKHFDNKWDGKEVVYEYLRERKRIDEKGKIGVATISKGDELRHYNINVEPIKKDHDIVGWLETINDITEIKEKDKLFVDVLDRFHIPVVVTTYPNLEIKYINMYGKELINKFAGEKLSLDEINSKTLFELNNEAINTMIRRFKHKNFLDSKQVDIKLCDGSIKTLKLSETPLYDKNNNLKTVVIAGVDITEEFKFLKAKDQFFSIISHELRSPANIIIAASQLLLTDKYRKELKLNAVGHIEKIQINSYRLLRLINNFLDIQKSEAGYLKLNMVNFDIVSFSEELANSITHLTDSKKIQVIFDTEFEEKIIALDVEKYERILLNLLSNATKFTPEGGKILVNIFKSKNNICISVKDTGIGIAKDQLKKIFKKFTIVDSTLSRVGEGTGLGLNLVKILVEKMEGTISVYSVEGKGTEFIVSLPDKKIESKELATVKRTKKELEHITNIEFSDINQI